MVLVLTVLVVSLAYLTIAQLERVPVLQFRALPTPRPFLVTDMAWFAVAIAATAASMFGFRPVLTRLTIGPLRDRTIALPLALKIVLGLVMFDLVSFLVHKGLHRSDLLWNLHKVHHSTLELDGFATTRAHMFENMVRFLPGQALLLVVGMPAGVVATTLVIYNVYGITNHSNLNVKLPWIETVLVTPRMHRSHHVPATTQNNFGGMFTFWDRAFGTMLRGDITNTDRYGVPGEIDSYPQHFAQAVRQPVRQLRELRLQRRTTATIKTTAKAGLAEQTRGRLLGD